MNDTQKLLAIEKMLRERTDDILHHINMSTRAMQEDKLFENDKEEIQYLQGCREVRNELRIITEYIETL